MIMGMRIQEAGEYMAFNPFFFFFFLYMAIFW